MELRKCNLDKAVIEEELQIFSKLGIEVILNRLISPKELEQIMNEYNAVFLGTGEWDENLQIDSETFQVQYSSLFAGGSIFIKMARLFYR
jgi:NADPH-dependent glutamate synthase beta subunit-like oxidoreductase